MKRLLHSKLCTYFKNIIVNFIIIITIINSVFKYGRYSTKSTVRRICANLLHLLARLCELKTNLTKESPADCDLRLLCVNSVETNRPI